MVRQFKAGIMKKMIALIAIMAIGFGEAAPALAQTRKAADTTKVKKSRKKPVKKKTRYTTSKKL
ncbi:MAG: hypothetical protein JST32_04240 [Bacteroidetes bacterium]|nr:hypothetical protein [Bacteroidota bacterium]